MATITINPIREFDATFRQFTIYYNIELADNGDYNGISVTSNASWCNIKNGSITPYQTDVELSTNNTFEEREATITFVVDTNEGIITATTTVKQSGFEVYPIWANKVVKIQTQTNWVKYTIRTNSEIIYSGKAYLMPNAEFVEIDITEICSNYLNSTMEKGFNDLEEVNLTDGAKVFALYVNDELYSSFLFYNSYTYKGNPNYSQYGSDYFLQLNEPIRNIFDSRQYIPFSFFNVLETSNYNVYFKFYINGYNEQQITKNCFGHNLYTTLLKTPSGYNTIHFLGNQTPIATTCATYCLYYQNALGGWDSFLINGNNKQTDKITSYKYKKSINNTTRDFENKKYLNVFAPTYTLYTDWLTDEEASKMHNLLESTEVYLHNLNDDIIQPVNITNNSCEYKTFSNNGKKKFYYQIDVEVAQTRIRQ